VGDLAVTSKNYVLLMIAAEEKLKPASFWNRRCNYRLGGKRNSIDFEMPVQKRNRPNPVLTKQTKRDKSFSFFL